MARKYKSKNVQTKPELAGEQNMPMEFVKRHNITDIEELKTLEGSVGLFKIAMVQRKRGTNWKPEELAQYVGEYFQYCVDKEMKPNKAGIALWLGMSKSQLWEWATKPEKYGVISNIIQTANYLMENSYIQRGEKYPTMNTFLLRTGYGYVEKQKVDITSRQEVTTEEIDDVISKLGLDEGDTKLIE